MLLMNLYNIKNFEIMKSENWKIEFKNLEDSENSDLVFELLLKIII